MKMRREDGSITKGEDWAEVSFSSGELLLIVVFAAIGLIATVNWLQSTFSYF